MSGRSLTACVGKWGRGCCLFERPHHQRVWTLLNSLNAALLAETHTFFGGGTAIVLQLGEYRESVDVDLLCADHEGYRLLRNTVNEHSLGALLTQDWPLLRGVRSDRYGIRAFCEVDGVPIKLEIIREDRITLQGEPVADWPVFALARPHLYAEKLLANADRWADRSTASRDLIDLALMIHHWGPIPLAAWAMAHEAYGRSVNEAYAKSVGHLLEGDRLATCLSAMAMAPALHTTVAEALRSVTPPSLP